MKKVFGQIGIPFPEVSDRLSALNESLVKHDMALKCDTGIQMEFINGEEPRVLGFTLSVIVFSTKQEDKEDEQR